MYCILTNDVRMAVCSGCIPGVSSLTIDLRCYHRKGVLFMKRILGFTLIEAVLSVALFGIVIAILFSAINGFQKGWMKEYTKQAVSSQFVKVYRVIDSDVSGSAYYFFHDYKPEDSIPLKKCQGNRWFMFPISKSVKDSSGNLILSGVNDDGYPIWTHLIVYHLEVPKDDKCKPELDQNKVNPYCPHKHLVRHEIQLSWTPRVSELMDDTFNQNLKGYIDRIPYIINSKYGDDIDLSAGKIARVVDRRVVGTDITDLLVDSSEQNKIRFKLTLLRIMDAEKHITVRNDPGGTQTKLIEATINDSKPSDDTVRRYIEETGWISLTNN